LGWNEISEVKRWQQMKLSHANYIAMNLKDKYKFHIGAREIKKYYDEYLEVFDE